MTTRIDKAFNDIKELFKQISEKNKEQLEAALIKPIHDKYQFAQNGICSMIALMGSGKSLSYLIFITKQEIMKLDEPFYELVTICSTSSKFDKTVETFKEAIKKSKPVNVKDTELLDWLNKYMRRILKYNAIVEFANTKFKELNEEIQ